VCFVSALAAASSHGGAVASPFAWTPAATEILARACDWFGGEAAWRRIAVVRLHANGLSGLLPLLKGNGRTFEFPRTIEVSPHERAVRFLEYPSSGLIGVYEDGAVRIERAAGGEVVECSPDHRHTFRGLAKNRLWTPLDALYFFGYALVHYQSLPFSLASAKLVGVRKARFRGADLDAVAVEFPPDAQIHSRRETFCFDGSGCLVRHDYVADVMGVWARGAHLWQNVLRVNGFPIAMERHVIPRYGPVTAPMVTALHASFHHAEIELAPAPPSPALSV
jgi:hypothetical protein